MYRHTQIGWVILIATSLVFPPLIYLSVREGDPLVFAIPAVVISIIEALFATLTVEIDEQHFVLRFGIGVIRRTIQLNRIRAFAQVRNPWYYGWGVRVTPHGMLYNVSGRSAVELLLDDGRRVRVGTDEPEALTRALEGATRIARTASVDDFPKNLTWGRRVRSIAGIVGAMIAVWIAWTFYAHSQPPSVEMSSDRFFVGSGMYSANVPVEEIQTVQLLDRLPRIIRRTNGFAAFGLLRGNFRLEEWGSGKLFINRDVPPYVVVRTRDSFLVVNFPDSVKTRDVHDRLRELARSPMPEANSP